MTEIAGADSVAETEGGRTNQDVQHTRIED